MNIDKDYIIRLRREIHMYSEVDYDLPKTVALVERDLKQWKFLIQKSMEKVVGKENIKTIPFVLGSEDFSRFTDAVPSVFFALG